jgi:RNA polymerase sigma-70 factor (ECF subfamily)
VNLIGVARRLKPPLRSAELSEATLVDALRRGDEKAFMDLVELYHESLVRLALMYVSSRAVAEDVVQETWVAVLRGIDRFEGRSSLKTWIFSILINRAKTTGVREHRSIPFSSLEPASEPSVDPRRFNPEDDPRAPGAWALPPRAWGQQPEERALSGEIRSQLDGAIAELPDTQRAVVTLRDLNGLTSSEVADMLEITPNNERVLLHRGRSRVRALLESYFDGDVVA